MRERPILFSGAMVRAILEGRKTQTRRAIRNQKPDWAGIHPDGSGLGWIAWAPNAGTAEETARLYPGNDGFACPYGVSGDRLWVRESGWEPRVPTEREFRDGADTWRYAYDADGLSESDVEDFKAWGWKRRPSIFMPRLASRITLEITDVRVQRVQEVTEEDATAEGCPVRRYTDGRGVESARLAFRYVWDTVRSGERLKRGEGWDANPWVWAITFRRIS